MYKVTLILDTHFLKYEGGEAAQIDPTLPPPLNKEKLPSKSPDLLESKSNSNKRALLRILQKFLRTAFFTEHLR